MSKLEITILVTPGRMTPVSSGGVTSSWLPSVFRSRMKRFMAPTSVMSCSGPNSHKHCWQPCCSAI